jgi:hypothetical protein
MNNSHTFFIEGDTFEIRRNIWIFLKSKLKKHYIHKLTIGFLCI